VVRDASKVLWVEAVDHDVKKFGNHWSRYTAETLVLLQLYLRMLCLKPTFLVILTWNIKCSRTVSVPMNRSCCWTYAETAVNNLLLTGIPLIDLIPDSITLWSLLNVREFNKVVLPAPLDPIRANSSPGRAEPLTAIVYKYIIMLYYTRDNK